MAALYKVQSFLPNVRWQRDNQISVRTVMNAYEQLLAEEFIVSEEKEDILLRRFTKMI